MGIESQNTKKDKIYLSDLISGEYRLSLDKSDKIKPYDIVLNAGLRKDISSDLEYGKIKTSSINEMYGILIDDFSGKSEFYAIYNRARKNIANKSGIERAVSMAKSVYRQLFFRMMEYSDSYSIKSGIMTPGDLHYMEEESSRNGKVFSISSVIREGPFLCHEFAVVLYLVLSKEEQNTGFTPFYTMGYVEKNGEKAEHAWIELDNGKERFLLDPISGTYEFIRDRNAEHLKSKEGAEYTRESGPFIMRMLKMN